MSIAPISAKTINRKYCEIPEYNPNQPSFPESRYGIIPMLKIVIITTLTRRSIPSKLPKILERGAIKICGYNQAASAKNKIIPMMKPASPLIATFFQP